MPKSRLPVIRASEIGEYVYCARSWWLRRVMELEPSGVERRELGVALHQMHGRAEQRSRMVAWVAVALFLLGGCMLWFAQ